ncbi:hypothetical protein BC832DRAFT_588701 [Gaertneriomyces semiglobifer]|nr:hypothetical protein BC832DRAFT_588701 [Gaertneriomyces semiglobifer]
MPQLTPELRVALEAQKLIPSAGKRIKEPSAALRPASAKPVSPKRTLGGSGDPAPVQDDAVTHEHHEFRIIRSASDYGGSWEMLDSSGCKVGLRATPVSLKQLMAMVGPNPSKQDMRAPVRAKSAQQALKFHGVRAGEPRSHSANTALRKR